MNSRIGRCMRRFRTGWVTVRCDAVAGPAARLLVRRFRLRRVFSSCVMLAAQLCRFGDWQFHAGTILHAAPDFDDSAWQSIEVGRPWRARDILVTRLWLGTGCILPCRERSEDWQLALLSP